MQLFCGQLFKLSLHRNNETMDNNSCPLLFWSEANNVVCMALPYTSTVKLLDSLVLSPIPENGARMGVGMENGAGTENGSLYGEWDWYGDGNGNT